MIDKIPKINFPPHIKENYDSTFEFHIPKFPPLPTSEFGLAFSQPPPKWYPFGSLKVLENESKNRLSIIHTIIEGLSMLILNMYESYPPSKKV